MKEILIIPLLLAFIFFGVLLYAADNNKKVKVHKVLKPELVRLENFELQPSVLVI